MFKKWAVILFMICSVLVGCYCNPVEASTGQIVYRLDEAEDCESLFGDPTKDGTVANFLQQIFSIIGYAAPLLCLVLSVFEFVKATASQDKDALAKALKRTLKRIVYAILLFFLPMLINFLFPLLGWYGTCGIQ